MITDLWNYLTDPARWSGSNGLGANIADHLLYTGIAVGVALLIAVPLGLLIGHTGRGGLLVIGTLNASRALPTFGLMVLLYILIAPLFTGKSQLPQVLPVEIVLLLLAIPPILSNTYAGVQSVDPAVRDAAKGMGMSGRQVLFRVELPLAVPLMMSGLRSATLQVVATATVGAYIGLGGLGLPIYAGIQQGPFRDTAGGHLATGRVLAGAFLVAALALVLDLLLATIQRYISPRGISGRHRAFTRAASSRSAAATAASDLPASDQPASDQPAASPERPDRREPSSTSAPTPG